MVSSTPFASNVGVYLRDVAEFDVDEHAWRGEFCAVDFGDGFREGVLLRVGEGADVLDFVEGHGWVGFGMCGECWD